MKLNRLATAVALAAVCTATPLWAAPTVLDMNSLGWDLSAGQNSLSFVLSSTGGFSFVGNSSNCWPACADNGSNYIWSGSANIGLREAVNATFDLTSFDGAETHMGLPSIWAGAIQVTGRYANGSTVMAQFVLDGINDGPGGLVDFQTFSLPSTFSGLTAVSFTVAGTQYGQFALDNIVLNGSFASLSQKAAVTVSEPGSLGLACAALLLAAAVVFRRRSPLHGRR